MQTSPHYDYFLNDQSIGAVNTIVRRRDDGKLVGYNTDCEAAIVAMEDALQVPKLLILVVYKKFCNGSILGASIVLKDLQHSNSIGMD